MHQLAVLALDRLVSTQDYADFARTFAGVGKASAARLSDGHRELVHVTVAAADGAALLASSDLLRNLHRALLDFGDPYQPVRVVPHELLLLVVEARVRVQPDYLWEKVEPKVRAALLEEFGFHRRDLGQDARLSEVFRVIQSVEGVAFVDVDVFDALDEDAVLGLLAGGSPRAWSRKERITAEAARVDRQATKRDKRLRPAQLVCFTPDVPHTIILNEVPS
jgi:hypothetical protein